MGSCSSPVVVSAEGGLCLYLPMVVSAEGGLCLYLTTCSLIGNLASAVLGGMWGGVGTLPF